MTTHDLADRLTRLERENRRLKRTGTVVLIGIVALVVMGQAKRPEVHDVLAAKQFILKDRDGKDRAMWYMLHSTATLGLFDGDGRNAVTLSVRKDGSALFFLGGRTSLLSNSDSANLSLRGGRVKGGEAGLEASLNASPDRVSFELRNAAGKGQAAIALGENQPVRAYLLDREGKDIFRVPK